MSARDAITEALRLLDRNTYAAMQDARRVLERAALALENERPAQGTESAKEGPR